MKEIPLTKGFVALVDDADFDWLSEFSWHVSSLRTNGLRYAYRKKKINGRGISISMHCFIFPPRPGLEIDHVDRNGLNNQRLNLREATRGQNFANRGPSRQNVSGFKGVSFHRSRNRWIAQLGNARHGSGCHLFLGRFDDPKLAAAAYDKAALARYGEFALTNHMLGLI